MNYVTRMNNREMPKALEPALRVHVAPVGDDLPARIVRPLIHGKADRVYLVHHEEDQDLFKNIRETVKAELNSNHILPMAEIHEISVDFYDFEALFQTYTAILRLETDRGNAVYLNVSTGGKLNSLTAMFACQLFGGHPYFCKKDFSANVIPENPEILAFPRYPVQQPPRVLVEFLQRVVDYMGVHGISKISKKECIEILAPVDEDFSLSTKKGRTSGAYNMLRFRYLDPLESTWGFIKMEHKPRGKILITPEGLFGLKIFSIHYSLREWPLP